MSGIRVCVLGSDEFVTEKSLHAYFANPNNGGGKISSIHYPVFGGDAVIIFEEKHTAEVVKTYQNQLKIDGKGVFITILPQLQVFRRLTAELDPGVASFLEVTEEARDEIIHHGNIDYHQDCNANIFYMSGTWYQLEWAWKYLDEIMYQQQKALDRSVYRKNTGIDKRKETMTKEEGDVLQSDTVLNNGIRNLGIQYGGETLKDGSFQLTKGSMKIPGDEVIISVPVEDDEDEYEEMKIVDDDRKDGTVRKETFIDKATAEMRGQATESKIQRRISEGGNVSHSPSKIVVSRSLSVEDKDSRNLRTVEFEHAGLKVGLYTGDITLSETDAIVNAGMDDRLGVSYAIYSAAGPLLSLEIEDYIGKYGKLETGDVMHTSAGGDLHSNVKHVIHTVGPLWTTDLAEDVGAHELSKTFLNCLNYANSLKITSLVFPAISTGTYCGSVDVCAKSFLDAILLFTYELRGKLHIKEVYLVNKHEDSTANMILFLRQLLKKGMDLLTIEALEEDERMRKKVEKKPGLIAKMKAGVSDLIWGSDKEPTGPPPGRLQAGKKTMAQKGLRPLAKRPKTKIP